VEQDITDENIIIQREVFITGCSSNEEFVLVFCHGERGVWRRIRQTNVASYVYFDNDDHR
jgi:hypothetical protein